MDLGHTIAASLRSDSIVDASRVNVMMRDNVAVLAGCVPTYAEKCRATEIARRFAGTVDVQNDLDVRITIGDYRTDATLERILQQLLDALALMPAERPHAAVKEGWVTLSGDVRSPFQKQLAEDAVRPVAGIRGLTNAIAVVPAAQ